MKVILFISIFCVSIGAAFAADLKVGDKCVTSSGAAGTVGVKYTEKGEAVGLKCIENAAVKAHEPAVLTADKQARRADGIGDYQFPKSTCLTQCTKNGKVDEHCFRMCGKMGRPNEKPAASIGQGKAIDGKPFKFEILPSDKCVLQKLPEVDPQLKCINLKSTAPVGPPINPTKPGDPRPENQQTKRMPTSPSEMQTVLDWCRKKSGAWTSDGRNGGTCRFPSVNLDSPIFDRWGNMKTKNDCVAGGGVWDGGDGKGGCTGPLKGSKK